MGLLQFAAFVAMVFILTNYLQQVRGYSALSAGLVFLPAGIVSLVTSGFFSAQLINRFGVKPIIISGLALQTIAYLLLSPISITESYIRTAWANAPYRGWNWTRNHCNEHSRTHWN